MDKALLDTDILSEVLKARDASVVSRAAEYQSELERLTISTVTVMEVVKGLHKVAREDALQQFLDRLGTVEVLPFDQNSATIAGRIYADLRRRWTTYWKSRRHDRCDYP